MATKSRRKVEFDVTMAQAQAKADEAELAAVVADSERYHAAAELYDQYTSRQINNATSIGGFRRRPVARHPKPTPRPAIKSDTGLAEAILKASAAEALADRAREDAKRMQARADSQNTKLPAQEPTIKQGVKASVDTVPMPVRLEVEQVRMLKLLASYEQTTASAIIRACIKTRLEQARQGNPGFDAAVRSSIEK